MEIAYFLKLFKRNWIFISLIAISAASITFVLISLKNKEYYSRAQLSAGITDKNQVSFDKSELSWNEVNSKFTNFLEFLNSKEVYTMLSYRMLIQEIESKGAFKPEEYKELLKKYSISSLETAKAVVKQKYEREELLDLNNKDDQTIYEMLKIMYYDQGILSKTLQISRITGSDYFKVEVKTQNPRLSSSLVNFYCQETIRVNDIIEDKRAEKSVAFFKDLRDKKKTDFERKLDSLSKVKSGSQVIDYSSQSEAHIDRISTLETAKNEEEKKVLGLRRAIGNIDSQLNQAEIKSNQSHQTNSSIINLKSKVEKLNEKYINSGFKDKALADSVVQLRQQLERQLSNLNQNVSIGVDESYKDLIQKKIDYEVELSIAEASLSSIQASIYSSKSSLTSFAGNEATLTPLEMGVTVAKDEYMNVVEKYNDARNEAMKNGAIIRQIEVGQPADEPEPLKRVVFSGVAAVASFIIGLSVLFLIAYFDNTIKNPENFSKNTGLPLLGCVYSLPKKSSNLDNVFFENGQHTADGSKFKEQLRNIRYEIEKENNKVFLFTSTEKEEGKSFVLVSLAYSLILNYKKILIIDTNFKHNTLSHLFKGNVAVEDYFYQPERKLLGTTNASAQSLSIDVPNPKMETTTEDVLQRTHIDGLDIISCKGNDLSPSEIFHGRRFEELLTTLRPRYDYIFLEGPSLNQYSDTKELADYCDKVVGVFASDKSIKQLDKVSIKYLKSIGNKYFGSILNKVDHEDLLV